MNKAAVAYRERWLGLVAMARVYAADVTLEPQDLAARAAQAQREWVSPSLGKEEGYVIWALLYACRGYGGERTIKRRAQLADLLKAAAEAVAPMLDAPSDGGPADAEPQLKLWWQGRD